MRVLVGVGHLLLREGLARVLESEQAFDVVGLLTTEEALTRAVDELRPDVLIVSAALPPEYGDEGVRLAARLRHERPEMGCVLLGDSVRPAHFLALVADGVAGCAYLLVERIYEPEELMRAVQAVAVGGSVVDPVVVESLAARPDEAARIARLTARELDVLNLIAEGESNAAIAASLGMTTRGVEKHISEIFVRLDIGNGAEVSRRVAAALVFLRATGRLALSG